MTPLASGQAPVDPLGSALDKDGDGTLSAVEIDQATETLRALDKNGDGALTLDEIGPEFGRRFGPPGFGGRGPQMEKREIVSQFDADGDGRLNRDERAAARVSLEEDGDRRGPFGRGRRGPR